MKQAELAALTPWARDIYERWIMPGRGALLLGLGGNGEHADAVADDDRTGNGEDCHQGYGGPRLLDMR